ELPVGVVAPALEVHLFELACVAVAREDFHGFWNLRVIGPRGQGRRHLVDLELTGTVPSPAHKGVARVNEVTPRRHAKDKRVAVAAVQDLVRVDDVARGWAVADLAVASVTPAVHFRVEVV